MGTTIFIPGSRAIEECALALGRHPAQSRWQNSPTEGQVPVWGSLGPAACSPEASAPALGALSRVPATTESVMLGYEGSLLKGSYLGSLLELFRGGGLVTFRGGIVLEGGGHWECPGGILSLSPSTPFFACCLP